MLSRVTHTDVALVVVLSVFETEMAIVKMKRYSSSAVGHIPTAVIHLIFC
jgi:hypothetical protein